MGLAQVRLEKHSPNHFISAVHLFVLQADAATNAAPDSQALVLAANFVQNFIVTFHFDLSSDLTT